MGFACAHRVVRVFFCQSFAARVQAVVLLQAFSGCHTCMVSSCGILRKVLQLRLSFKKDMCQHRTASLGHFTILMSLMIWGLGCGVSPD